jgi:uncharacterized iron-regulated membrane protein
MTLPGRPVWVRLHRWAGLATALFLFVAGLTGSFLAFGPDIDAWLNPKLFQAPGRGPALDMDTLAGRIEAAHPRLQVEYLTLPREPGRAAFAFVWPRDGVAGQGADAIDQVFIDPVTGELLGARRRGACCLEPEHLYYFMLHVHHSLFLPGRWGWWFMGGVAIVWLLDCFIGLLLTLPFKGAFWKQWLKAWRIKAGAGAYRLNLDLHRAGGLWLWIALLVLALSSVALNLKHEVFRPVVSWFSPLTPEPGGTAVAPSAPTLGFERARQLGDAEARARGWDATTSGVSHFPSMGVYLALLWPSHADRGLGLGEPILYFDSVSGELVGEVVPGRGSAGDVFAQAQFPLHSGQVAGLPGRIFIAISGVVVAVLSVTGVVIWWKKRRARRFARHVRSG